MPVTFDPAKRENTLRERGLDFAEADQVLAGAVVERHDDRFDYGEVRASSIGLLHGAVVVVV